MGFGHAKKESGRGKIQAESRVIRAKADDTLPATMQRIYRDCRERVRKISKISESISFQVKCMSWRGRETAKEKKRRRKCETNFHKSEQNRYFNNDKPKNE